MNSIQFFVKLQYIQFIKKIIVCCFICICLSALLELLFSIYLPEQVLFNRHTMKRSSTIATKTKLMKRFISNNINSCFCIKCERKLDRKCVDSNSLYVNHSSSYFVGGKTQHVIIISIPHTAYDFIIYVYISIVSL